jgi:asparagine synthase (glutamine-hydrolysing)
MCGIFTLLNNDGDVTYENVFKEFNKCKNRGPEFSILEKSIISKLYMGFHRLAINGIDSKSNQPFVIKDSDGLRSIFLICNGEIYNYKELYALMNITPETNSDCEVIGHLYMKYGIQQTLTMLDGVFSFVLLDTRYIETGVNCIGKLYIARDPYGVRPLYQLTNSSYRRPIHFNSTVFVGFASELKCLTTFYNKDSVYYSINQFTPGTYSVYSISEAGSIWLPERQNVS